MELHEKADLLVEVLDKQVPGASLGEQLGTDVNRKYAAVFSVHLGDRHLVMKFLHPADDLPLTCAQLILREDERALKSGLPNVAKYLGTITDIYNAPICVLSEYVKGEELPVWLGKHPEGTEQIRSELVRILSLWQEQGFHLVDENQTNFLVGEDGSITLIDPAAISKRECCVHDPAGVSIGLIGDGGVLDDLEFLGIPDDSAGEDVREPHDWGVIHEEDENDPQPLSIDEVVSHVLDAKPPNRSGTGDDN